MAISEGRLSKEGYNSNFQDINPPFENYTAAAVEANRCLFCYDAPCMKSCPTSIDVPKFIKQISTENIKGSAHTIFSSNIMGGGCSKVCPVEKLCEGACVYNLLEEEPIQIARLQRYSTEIAIRERWGLFTRKASTGKKVAIVGAGPAGLSCAHVLSREGVDVTIFEKQNKGGGLITYGIAAYKVTPEFCQEEVDYILSIGGIEIRYGQTLGKDIFLNDLEENFHAVFLGMGVGLTRKLGIPGEELNGIADAIDFIYDIRTKPFEKIPVGNKVAVIGMGMTAIDAATQAKRLGAEEVTLVYRRSQAEMPCTETELNIAKLDGCKIIWQAAPREITGFEGKVNSLICDLMSLDSSIPGDRRSPKPTGQTIQLDVDMIIKATGQLPFEELVDKNEFIHKSGRIMVDDQHETSIASIFAGGDCVNGGKEVVDAVQAGKESAAGILNFLKVIPIPNEPLIINPLKL
ncbi:NAD(P)-dependent oxidoreductase [Daejeonella sp.]|uniref:NAD(P)-dependent oxidoreductase n=1 Tax=Daejeonella sp. TaxID=2805397 RepID=UPI003982E910